MRNSLLDPIPKIECNFSHHLVARDPSRHLAFPDACCLPSGEILVVYRDGQAHVDVSGRIMLSRAQFVDGILNSSMPTVVCDSNVDDRDPSLCLLSTGTLVLNFFRLNDKPRWQRLAIARSYDEGLSWESPQDVIIPGFSHGLATSDAIVELPDGELCMAVYGKNDNGEGGSFLLKSRDMGMTWPEVIPLAVASAPIFEEPTLTCLSDGRLVALLRTDHKGLGYLYKTWSEDRGETWTKPLKLDVWGYPSDVLELEDNRVLVTYGYRQLPTGIRGCVVDSNLDCSISDETIIRGDGHDEGELGYPASVTVKTGEVCTFYYFTDKQGGLPYIMATSYKIH